MPTNRSEAIGPLFSLFVVAAVIVLQPASAQQCAPDFQACYVDATCTNCVLSIAGQDVEEGLAWAECVRTRYCSITGLVGEDCPEVEVTYPGDPQPPVPADYTIEVCALITAEACCIDDLQLNEDCMGSTAFLKYWDCFSDFVIESQGQDGDCPDLTSSCPDVVDVTGGGGDVDVDVPIDTGDGGEDGGSTTPVAPAPTTPAPVTPAPTTPAPVTPVPTTPAPVMPASTTPTPVTPASTTPAPVTPVPTTPAPVMPASTTPAPATPAPATPALVAPATTTPTPVTPASTTPAPVTPVPTTPTPAPGTASPVDNGSGDGDRDVPVESDDPDARDSTPTGDNTDTGAGTSSPSAAVTLVVGLAVLALATFF